MEIEKNEAFDRFDDKIDEINSLALCAVASENGRNAAFVIYSGTEIEKYYTRLLCAGLQIIILDEP